MNTLNFRKSSYSPHQWKFLTCESQIKALVSGFGAGKTHIFLRECLKQHITNKRDSDGLSAGWVLYPTLDLAQDLFIDDFKLLLDKQNIPYQFSVKHNKFKTAYGSIRIYTLEKPERMVGSNLTWCGIDEFDTARKDKAIASYKKVLGRLRGNNTPCLFIVTTPEGFSATYQIFVEEASNVEDKIQKTLIHAKTTDNPHLPEDYVELLESDYDEKMLKAYIEGQFVNLNSGCVYYGFEREHNLKEGVKIDPHLPIDLFFDFNVHPMSAGLAQSKNANDIRVIKEWVLKGHSSTWDMCNAIKRDLSRDYDVVIYGDASGSAHSSKSNMSDYDIIDEELGNYFRSIEFDVPKANIAVRARVNCVNNILQKRWVLIDKESAPCLVRDFEQVTWTEKGDIDKSNIALTHISDAFGYYADRKHPLIERSDLIRVTNIW